MEEVISWQTTERTTKSIRWYLIITLQAVIFAGGAYWLTNDLIAPISIIAMMVLLMIFGLRSNPNQYYQLLADGLAIGKNYYPFEKFKSFSLVDQDNKLSAYFFPTERFVPPFLINLPDQDQEVIIERLSNNLPYTKEGPQFLDRLLSLMRLYI